MIILDASVLIAHLSGADMHHEAERLLLANDDPLAVSQMTLAEVLIEPERRGRLRDALDAVRVLGVTELSLPPDAAGQLARLCVETRLKLPDCCVILAAQQETATVATFDARLGQAARALGLSVVGQE